MHKQKPKYVIEKYIEQNLRAFVHSAKFERSSSLINLFVNRLTILIEIYNNQYHEKHSFTNLIDQIKAVQWGPMSDWQAKVDLLESVEIKLQQKQVTESAYFAPAENEK